MPKATPAKRIEITKKAARAFELVAQGKNFREVAEELGCSRSNACTLFQKALDEHKVPEYKVQEWRILLSQRLDTMIVPLMKVITGKESTPRDIAEAVRAVVRVEDRRARLLGLDKPTKVDITHHKAALDPEEAAKRQRHRFREAGFVGIPTAIPKQIADRVEASLESAQDVEYEEVEAVHAEDAH